MIAGRQGKTGMAFNTETNDAWPVENIDLNLAIEQVLNDTYDQAIIEGITITKTENGGVKFDI